MGFSSWRENQYPEPHDDDEVSSENADRPGEFDFSEDDIDLGDDFIASALAELEHAKEVPALGKKPAKNTDSDIEEFEIVMDDELDDHDGDSIGDDSVVQEHMKELQREVESYKARVSELEAELKRIRQKSRKAVDDFNDRLKEAIRLNKSLKDRLVLARKERDEAKTEAEENKTKWTEAVAEYQNVQRRARKKLGEFVEMEKRSAIKKFLPIYDNMCRSLSFSSEPTQAFFDGVRLIQKQFLDVLGGLKLKEIPALGEQFDPFCHEAVGRMPDDSVPNNTVVEVMQTGYYIEDQVLRVAKVTVSYTNLKDSNVSANSVESEKITLNDAENQSARKNDSEGVGENSEANGNDILRQGGSTG